MIELPIPSRQFAEAAAYEKYKAAIASLPAGERDAIVTFTNKLMDVADERHTNMRLLQVRHDDPVAVEGVVLDDRIAYIDIRSCGSRTIQQFDVVLEKVLAAEPVALILDVRFNVGGQAQVASHVASHFLPVGTAVARFAPTVAFDVDPASLDLTTTREPDAENIPLAIVTNRWTASTGEILAAALQNHGRATIVGEASFGKPHACMTLADGDTVSPGVFARPDGTRFDPQGVQPDIDATDDSAIEIAIERLR